MQRHMPTLDTFGGQGTQCAEVLRQADGDGDFTQFLGRFNPQDTQRQLRQRMGLGGTADQAQR